MKNGKCGNLLRIAALLLSLCLMMPVMVQHAFAAEQETEAEPECYVHGDANSDGKVNLRDAVYVLYYALQGEDGSRHPAQDCDYNGDGEVTADDAIFVMYNTLGGVFAESHALRGTVHKYYAPIWTWTEDKDGNPTAQAVLKCACGNTQTLTAEVTVTQNTAATCVNAGVKVYTATVTFGEETYQDTKTVTVPALGHAMEGVTSCEEGSACTRCDYKELPLGHNWVLDEAKSTAATCTTQGTQVYQCANEGCEATKTVTLDGFAKHSYTYNRTEKNGCEYWEVYRCVCGEETEGEHYYKHTYSATLTKEATCSEAGVKTFTCGSCGDTYTESVPQNDTHRWNDGVTENGITTYTCPGCGKTKTAVCVEGNNASVSQNALADTSEVQLSDVIVAMDNDVKAALVDCDTVSISIEKASASGLSGLSEAEKAQIGDNPVYDFTLQADDETVSSFDGSITVSLPYTLQSGDDVDCIDVWFIDDTGTVTCIKGTYSNGYVTFQTNHFSYYTVTRLTPAQRCAAYGHAIVSNEQAATCTQDGYQTKVCQRCGETLTDQKISKLGHSYTEQRTEPTCEQSGSFSKVCSVCGESISGELPALGHDWVEDEEKSSAATCDHAGLSVSVCRNCGETQTKELAQLEHDFGDANEVHADCTTQGSIVRTCILCGYEETLVTDGPTGHVYHAEDAQWSWNEDLSAATVTLVCANDSDHTKTLEAVVTSKTEAASCTGAGKITYTATASLNTVIYTDVRTVVLESVPHQPEEAWQSNAKEHYHLCQVCQEPLNTAEHVWGEQIITKSPTCAAKGESTQTCSVCGYTKKIILSATGEHNFVDGVCTECGYVENSCTHIRTTVTPLDLSAYDVCEGTEISIESCACGQVSYLIALYNCDFEYSEEQMELPNGQTVTVETNTCQKCGLVLQSYVYVKLDEATCTSFRNVVTRVLIDGVEIASGENVYSEKMVHYTNIVESTVDLAELGLCGGTLEYRHCYCGKLTNAVITNSACQWKYDSDRSDDDKRVYVCGSCGAVKTVSNSYAPGDEPCQMIDTNTFIYELNGEEILRYSYQDIYMEHDYKILSKELDGETCEDGVYLKYACQSCGHIYETYSRYHVMTDYAETPLDGFCPAAAVQGTCACGAYKEFYLSYSNGTYCDWETIDDNVARCLTCGLTHTWVRTEGPKDVNNNCLCQITVTHTYTDRDGNPVVSGEERYTSSIHNYTSSYTLLGDSCEDGITVTKKCSDCGYSYRYKSYGHVTAERTEYDLSKYGLCSGTFVVWKCPCGENNWSAFYDTSCQWSYVSGDENCETYRCSVCGATRIEEYGDKETISSCKDRVTKTNTFIKDGEEVLKVSLPITQTHHRYVCSFVLDGESCEDGYTVTETCLECGAEDQWRSYSHSTWTIRREQLPSEGLCGDLELITNSCACGRDTDQYVSWSNGACQFDNWVWIDEDTHQEACSVCGAVRTVSSTTIPIEGTCSEKETEQVTITKDGSTVCSYECSHTYKSHIFVCSFELNGTTCAEGYTVIEACQRCGETRRYIRSTGDCDDGYRIGHEVLLDSESCCGPIVKNTYGCACGENQWVYIEDDCQWEYVSNDSQGDRYICRNCGLEKIYKSQYTEDLDNCKELVEKTYIFKMDGQELVHEDIRYSRASHEYVYSLELLGDTCEDGFRVTRTCARCGKTQQDDGVYYGHATYRTAEYDLTDYGLCGGSIDVYSCACGQHSECNYNWGCSWSNTGKTDSETGLPIRYCTQCGTYGYWGECTEPVPESCWVEGTYHAVFTRGGETLLELHQPVSYQDHCMVMSDIQLSDPEQGCEGGYTITRKCLYCDETYTSSGTSHSLYNKEYVSIRDLYPDACGGYLIFRSCPCGENNELYRYDLSCENTSYSYNSSTDADGHQHEIRTYKCTDCGLTIIQDYYSVKLPNSCNGTNYYTVTVSAKGQELKTYSFTDTYSSHNYTEQYELLPGSVSCEDGLRVIWTCKDCGATSEGSTSGGHRFNLDAEGSIDLALYGSVCGGKLAHYVCACGAQQRYDLDPDLQCDMDRVYTSNWIDGTISDSQYTSEGYVGTYSHSYVLTCAVTEPQCGLKIRMSEYWLEENCVATEYQTWQLGYDADTKTCMQEITIPTGDRHTYHPYTYASISETLEDGTSVRGYQETCPQCGSYYSDKDYTLNGATLKNEEIAVNTLENGENKSLTRIYEYGLEYAGYRYMTLNRQEYVYADGSEYWYQYAYTYDFSQGCYRICTYTDSNGEQWTSQETAHQTVFIAETVKEPTCSQYGTEIRRYTCQVCDQVVDEWTASLTPTGHNWAFDSEAGFYRCSVCGLENTNGSSGSIVIEDLTDYDNSDVYTIGYWNRGNVEARRYVSVVLKEAEEGTDDEIVLTGIAFTELDRDVDGITAVTFNRDAVWLAAEQAVSEAEYTGAFAIRFTFVPINSTDTLDYAITFDTLEST